MEFLPVIVDSTDETATQSIRPLRSEKYRQISSTLGRNSAGFLHFSDVSQRILASRIAGAAHLIPHPAVHGARGDRIYVDVMFLQFIGEAFDEADQCRLACTVGGEKRTGIAVPPPEKWMILPLFRVSI